MATVNYDGLARDYAQHRRALPEVIEALVQGGSLSRDSRVLELGCGTGNYVRALEDAFERGRAWLERDLSAGPVAGVLRQTALWASKPDRTPT
jgi:ubiquinone/menaquinone biosynthesis C-methylase UbiE